MFNKEKLVKKWINDGYECVPKYDKVYGWYCNDKISEDLWFNFCQQCLCEIEMMIGVRKNEKS